MSIAEVDEEPFEMTEIATDHAVHAIFQGISTLEEMKRSNEGRHYMSHCQLEIAADRLARLTDEVRGLS